MEKFLKKGSKLLLTLLTLLLIVGVSKVDVKAASGTFTKGTVTSTSAVITYTNVSGTTYYLGVGLTSAEAVTDAKEHDHAVVSGNAITFSDLSAGNKYYIAALNTSDETVTTATFTTTIGATSNLKVKKWKTFQGDATISWTDQTACKFKYVLKNVSKSSTLKSSTTDASSLTFSGLSADYIYKITVTPYTDSDDINSDYAASTYIIPQSMITETDTGFDISVKSKKLYVNWNETSKVSGYEVYVSTKKDKGYKKVAVTNSATKSSATIKKYKGKKFNSKKTYYVYVLPKKKVSGTVYKAVPNYTYVYKKGTTYIMKYNGD